MIDWEKKGKEGKEGKIVAGYHDDEVAGEISVRIRRTVEVARR